MTKKPNTIEVVAATTSNTGSKLSSTTVTFYVHVFNFVYVIQATQLYKVAALVLEGNIHK